MSKPNKKNCHNCKHGYFDSDGEYGEYQYFVCEKRNCDTIEFENNLSRPEYLDKAKVCCDLRVDAVEAECVQCGDIEMSWEEDSKDFVCFCCFSMNEDKVENKRD